MLTQKYLKLLIYANVFLDAFTLKFIVWTTVNCIKEHWIKENNCIKENPAKGLSLKGRKTSYITELASKLFIEHILSIYNVRNITGKTFPVFLFMFIKEYSTTW